MEDAKAARGRRPPLVAAVLLAGAVFLGAACEGGGGSSADGRPDADGNDGGADAPLLADAGSEPDGRPEAATEASADGGSHVEAGGLDASFPFEPQVRTELDAQGRLVFWTNVPVRADECAPPAPCADADADGLVDAWEDIALDALRPRLRFDENEPALRDPGAVIAQLGRVYPASEAGRVRLVVLLLYSRDYGSPTCGGLTAHDGDVERVALELESVPEEPGAVRWRRLYLAAHENTPNDASRVYAEGELGQMIVEREPERFGWRWVVLPSEAKHATYPTREVCESVRAGIPCADEDCAPDGVADPDAFDRLPEWANAGEPDAPRLEDLSVLGFPGEAVWEERSFCGGRSGPPCVSSVRSKLLDDPFER